VKLWHPTTYQFSAALHRFTHIATIGALTFSGARGLWAWANGKDDPAFRVISISQVPVGYRRGYAAPKCQLYGQPCMRTRPFPSVRILRFRSRVTRWARGTFNYPQIARFLTNQFLTKHESYESPPISC
jgi:hypothetical protein